MKYKQKKFFRVLLICLVMSSCTTAEDAENWIYTQGKRSLTLSVDDKNQAVLTLPFDYQAEVHGEAFLEDSGEWIFHTDELHLFYNWYNGWTESETALQGILKLRRTEKTKWRIEIVEIPQILSVKTAQIRFKRDRIYHDRARDMANRRLNRALALAEIIPLSEDDYIFQDKKKGFYSRDYVSDLESFLFPEIYGFSTNFPEPESPLSKKERYLKNEELQWDTVYTENYYPEEFQDIRNTGTLFRDYEEASQLVLLCSRWRYLWNDSITQIEIQEQ
ncbi:MULTISPECIES: hypothetical protein [unclassified Oceanispirochaeta]|uniref:hypothetical protein n=1 Tax=unclassified Oceanispirochaeta TaxID=2635722 RepID=UPI000E0906A3|nr:MULTISPECIES: hypothetical protein [unclassified Oceanispirochaeta]MBF9015081.1 hypothetical protein [Oceanispirochaeta sp. M2]NPD71539.1 hypothetical protein [Oceanispirochaeta sp. M1]RDG33110.1 hypothetical protein DV872_05440 [Oceanispirochaeta sp. M1]